MHQFGWCWERGVNFLNLLHKVLGKLLMWCGVYCSNLFQGVWYMAKIAQLKEVGWRKGLESSVSSFEAGKLYYDIKKDM